MNVFRHSARKKGRPFKTFESGLRANIDKFGRFMARSNSATNQKSIFGKRQVKIATCVDVKLDGDYEQRRSVRTSSGVLGSSECRDTSRVRNGRPI